MDNGVSSYHRFLQGDTAALGELVRLYSDSLVRYAYCFVRNSEAAEDIMEDTFAALIVKRKKFTESENLKAYLFRTVRNRSIDYLRSKNNKTVPIDNVQYFLRGESAEELALNEMRNEQVYVCLQQLPAQYRDILFLSYFHGFSVNEIKKTTGKTRKQIYNLLARAKSTLKEILIKEGICYEDV